MLNPNVVRQASRIMGQPIAARRAALHGRAPLREGRSPDVLYGADRVRSRTPTRMRRRTLPLDISMRHRDDRRDPAELLGA